MDILFITYDTVGLSKHPLKSKRSQGLLSPARSIDFFNPSCYTAEGLALAQDAEEMGYELAVPVERYQRG